MIRDSSDIYITDASSRSIQFTLYGKEECRWLQAESARTDIPMSKIIKALVRSAARSREIAAISSDHGGKS